MLQGASHTAIGFVTSSVGTAADFPMGELQGALGNLGTICRIVSPQLWTLIYQAGIKAGRPTMFYLVAACGCLLQLVVLLSLHPPSLVLLLQSLPPQLVFPLPAGLSLPLPGILSGLSLNT